MIAIEQSRRDQGTFDEAQVTSFLVLEQLIPKRLISIHLSYDRTDLDSEFAASLKPTPTVDQAIAITFERSHEDRHPLAASGDRRLQTSDLDLETVIQPANGLNMVRLDLEHATPQPAPLKSVGGIAQGLQRQS
jgi:hypothetical protein